MNKTILTSFTNSRGDVFSTGEWIVAEYAIYQIGEIRDYGHNIGVDRSTGYILCGGRADECWKLTLTTKIVADGVQRYREKLNELKGTNSFNWPDIHRKLVEFAEIGYMLDRKMPRKKDDYDDAEKRNAEFKRLLWEPLDQFYQEVKKLTEDLLERKVDGVRIIGR